jgi:O-acetylhomoserine/O-acetylserine sulfhydrylase-like pyridoxal-dependent enzyme
MIQMILKHSEKQSRKTQKAIFIESISNPNTIVSDIEAIAKIAHEHNIPLIVDNTFATPYLLTQLNIGADIVIYSATKSYQRAWQYHSGNCFGKRQIQLGERKISSI